MRQEEIMTTISLLSIVVVLLVASLIVGALVMSAANVWLVEPVTRWLN